MKYMTEPRLEDYGIDPGLYADYHELELQIHNLHATSTNEPFLIKYILFPWLAFGASISLGIGFILGYSVWGSLIVGLLLYLWISPYLIDSDWFQNILSLGIYTKYKRNKQQNEAAYDDKIDSLRRRRDAIRTEASSFEETLVHYHTQRLAADKAKIFGKKSGGKDFEEYLRALSSSIDGANEVNEHLISTHITTQEYEHYLTEREKGHIFRQSQVPMQHKKSLFAQELENALIETVQEPQVAYRTPRKLDWDKINKARMETGLWGEKYVLDIEKEHLIAIGKPDLAGKVVNVAFEQGDGAGYDILSFFADGKEKYIEVKTTKKSHDNGFDISRNELSFLRDNRNSAYVYRLSIDDKESSALLKVISVDEIQSMDIIPTQFIVKTK